MYRNIGWLNEDMMKHLTHLSKKLVSPHPLVLTAEDMGILTTIKRRNVYFQHTESPMFAQSGFPGCHA